MIIEIRKLKMKKFMYEYNEINKMRNDWNWNDWIMKWKEKN